MKDVKHFYHATHIDNLGDILTKGIEIRGEGVYLADSAFNAAKFLIIRGLVGSIIVFKIKASKLDLTKLKESFDHSEDFFQCKAYLYDENIKEEMIDLNSVVKF